MMLISLFLFMRRLRTFVIRDKRIVDSEVRRTDAGENFVNYIKTYITIVFPLQNKIGIIYLLLICSIIYVFSVGLYLVTE